MYFLPQRKPTVSTLHGQTIEFSVGNNLLLLLSFALTRKYPLWA